MTLIQSTRFFIPTMTCPSCQGRVTRALRSLEGVDQVQVQFPKRQVIVNHDVLTVSRQELSAALEAAHYPGEILEADV